MNAIIAGKLYDTKTATEICSISGTTYNVNDNNYEDTRLYKSPKGQYFLAGEGGPSSRWAKSCGVGAFSGGSGLVLVTEQEAREIVEANGSPEDYANCFGTPEEG